MEDLADGGFVKKYHVALFLNTGTPVSPEWTRIKKSTDNTITMNAETKDFDFISDEAPTTVLDRYKPSLSQPLTMIKGEPDYEYFFGKFFAQATGNDAETEMLIVFYNAKTGGAYKAWKTPCLMVFDNMNPVEGTITANVNFNSGTVKGTATVSNGVPVFSATSETWFQLEVTVSYDASAVSGATVTIGGTEKKTNASGKAYFTVKDGEEYALGAWDASNHSAAVVFTAASATTTKAITLE